MLYIGILYSVLREVGEQGRERKGGEKRREDVRREGEEGEVREER